MSYVKNLKPILSLQPHLLIIKAHTTFGQTFSKIKKAKNTDFVLVQQSKLNQMVSVLLTRLVGKKFIWIQNFENPPAPNFLTRLMLAQSDKIIVKSRRDFNKLIKLGIQKSKIRYQR